MRGQMSNPTRVTGPMELSCRQCFSQPGEACTEPTETGRRAVRWTHLIRSDDATCTCDPCVERRLAALG